LNVGKVLLLAKQTQVHAEETRGTGIKMTQRQHEEARNAAGNLWQSVQGQCRTVFENCRCSWNRRSWRSELKSWLF